MAKVYTERQILAEILELYKERPCIWDIRHDQYSNKKVRDEAFVDLLEKYQMICENATLEMLKRKIEHMRTTYRRERRKVLQARELGKEHKPLLWYYDFLTFLNDVDMRQDRSRLDTTSDTVAYIIENEEDNYEIEEVPNKRANIEQIIFTEPSSPLANTNQTDPMKDECEPTRELESELFGKTIGMQLTDLSATQRYIAEKLISDVIFYARLGQLTTNASIEPK